MSRRDHETWKAWRDAAASVRTEAGNDPAKFTVGADTMPGWIATTTGEAGILYARRQIRRHPVFQQNYESWDSTDERGEAHVFRTKAAAESHIADFHGWTIEPAREK